MDLSQFINLSDVYGVLPEIILVVTALILLSFEMIAKPRRRLMLSIAVLGYLFSAGVILKSGGEEWFLFQGMMLLNDYSTFLDILYIAVGVAALIFTPGYLESKGGELRGEYYALILFSTVGMMLMTKANDLIILFLGLELLSLSLYVLIGFLRHDVYSNEGGVKYLLLGAFTTGFFLFGIALIYGATGTINFNDISSAVMSGNILSQTLFSLGVGLLFIGFAFKVAIVPFHMWSPDVYQGAPTPVTAFLCTAPKAAGFGALTKVFLLAFPLQNATWIELFWILSVLTMTVGNMSALVQSNVKRMLAFSSVAHAGYLLIGVLILDKTSVSAILFYLLVYSAMNLGSFGVISLLEKGEKGLLFEHYKGLASEHPWLSAILALFLISLAGFPPTAGFVAKYAIFSAAIAKGYVWLIVIAVLNTVVSVYFYVRLIVNMYMKAEEEKISVYISLHTSFVLTVLATIVILFGILPGWLLNITSQAAGVLFK